MQFGFRIVHNPELPTAVVDVAVHPVARTSRDAPQFRCELNRLCTYDSVCLAAHIISRKIGYTWLRQETVAISVRPRQFTSNRGRQTVLVPAHFAYRK